MTTLRSLKNVGPKTIGWMEDVGIRTIEDLEQLGAAAAYVRLKSAFPHKISLNALWGLQGALLGIRWNQLPETMKADLLAQVAELERS
jgi:DNA transformation protein